ncbi:MAG: hypothetical protein KC613_21040, partial [Myxococcales bacterium]|nr:hypothetical protein [Myxococcales bacterium]
MRSWLPRGSKCVLAALAAVGAVGCDDAENNPSSALSVAIGVLPGTLTCADDLNRDTNDRLEVDVPVSVAISGTDPTPYLVRLSSGGAVLAERALVDGLSVQFERVPLPLGDITLSAELVLDGQVQASDSRNLTTGIDLSDPACGAVDPQITLTFEAPTAGATLGAADDLDGTLGNDVQVDVAVKVEGTTSGEIALSVDGAGAGRAVITDGIARFSQVTLGAGDGSAQAHRLQASLGDASATLDLSVEVGDCALEITPVPAGAACVPDADPATPGTQVAVGATTNCSTVTFVVNGAEGEPVPVADGQARTTVTVPAGDFTLGASAATAGGITGQVAPYDLTAAGSPATLNLNLRLTNDLLVADAAEGAWTISGISQGVPAGQAVSLTFNPPLEGAPAEAQVAEGGAFSFAVPVAPTATCHTVTAGYDDPCTGQATSPEYTVCFDGVVPQARLVAPADLALITGADDADPQLALLQVDATVQVIDGHDDGVDYDIGVECSADNGAVWVRRHNMPLRRSALDAEGNGVVRITLVPGDEGLLRCRPVLEDAPNAPEAFPETTWQVLFEAPTFAVQSPEVVDGRACVGATLPVGGVGTNLDGNDPALQAQILNGEGVTVSEAPLAATGNQGYQVEFGGPDGPAALPEGAYVLRVWGTVQGNVDVAVAPNLFPVVVDRTVPVLGLVAPAVDNPLGVADDADGDLANCVQTPLTLDVVDGNVAEVCLTLNGGQADCFPVDDAGRVVVPQVTLLDGANPLVVSAVDCAGNAQELQATLNTVGCPPRITVEAPADGARIAASVADLDPATAGVQIDVTVATALAQGDEIEVTVNGQPFGPEAVGADGSAVVRVTLPAPAGQVNPIAYFLQGRNADGSNAGPVSTVTVLFRSPAVAIRALGDCINAAVADASPAPGFQLAVTADVQRAEAGDLAVLEADCGAVQAVEAPVRADLTVTFPPVTLPAEGACSFTARVTDGAGQTGEGIAQVDVDRVAPQLSYLNPLLGAVITPANDEDRRDVPEAAGVQLTPRVRVCGAGGAGLTVVTNPVIQGGRFDLQVPAGEDCADLALPQLTLPQGQVTFTGTTADTCGNAVQRVNPVTVEAGASIVVVDPNNNQSLRAAIDTKPQVAGCQYTLVATTFGLGLEAEYTVCTDFAQGAGPELCNGESGAVDPDSAGCVAVPGNLVRCPISLQTGVHTLTVVGRFGERVTSQPIALRADCEAPAVTSVQVVEVGDDQCVNRQERLNRDDGNNTAAVTLRFTTEGLENGQTVNVLSEGGNRVLGNVQVQGNAGELRLNLAGGETHGIYLRGRDVAGNPLPAEGEGGNGVAVTVDVQPPALALLNLAADSCLNAQADTDVDAVGLQYVFSAQTGGTADEPVDLALTAGANQTALPGVTTPQLTFPRVTLAEGQQSATLTATDGCGNVASVGGFDLLAGRPDWTRPRPVAFEVDTVAPSVTLAGLEADRIYGAADDADSDAADGFQLDAQAVFDPADGIEAGAPVSFRSGGAPLSTTPTPLTIPADFDGTLAARLTLTPGAHAVTAVGTDLCGNVGTSDPVNITVDVGGCTSRLVGLDGDPTVFGPADGVVGQGSLTRAIAGQVDLLDPGCAGAAVELLADGAQVLAQGVAGADGAVALDAALPEGTYTLSLRVQAGADATLSPARPVAVDLTSPTVTFQTPANDPAVVIDDADPATPGLQGLFVVSVTEAPRTTARTATVALDGQVVAGPLAVGAGSPVLFSRAVTLTPGQHAVRICVADAVGHEGCATRQVNADPGAPGAVEAQVTVTDPRATTVEFSFTAPGEDGAEGGIVAGYRMRRATAAIANEAAWTAATVMDPQPATAAPGEVETLVVEGLALNNVHHVAIRAVDDVGRLGPV